MSRIKKVLVYGLALWLLKFAVVHIIVNADTTVVAIANLRKTMHKHMLNKLGASNEFKTDWKKLTPRQYIAEFTRIMNLKLDVKGKIPKSGKLVVIANHDNLLAGTFLSSIFDEARGADVTKVVAVEGHVPGNLRVVHDSKLLPGAEETIKTHLDTNNPLVIFPKTGDYYTAHQDKRNPTFRFMDGFLRFAIDNESDILPVKVHLDYPWWWRIMWFVVPKDLGMQILRTYMYQIFQNTTLHITIGDVIPYSKIKQDASKSYTKRGKTRYPDDVVAKYEGAIVGLG